MTEPTCPICRQGKLVYPVDMERGHCLRCHLEAVMWVNGTPLQQDTYRTEYETYGEGIYDDD